jgi:acyl carrier protein
MEETEVREKIKEIISNVTNLPVDQIADDARFREDLDLDSLSLLEIGVDVDYEFRLELPEEQLQKIGSVDDAVALALRILADREGRSEVA